MRYAGDSLLLRFYFDALRDGYTLLGAIPASLAMGTLNRIEPLALAVGDAGYLLFRMGFTLVVVVTMLTVLAVQALAGPALDDGFASARDHSLSHDRPRAWGQGPPRNLAERGPMARASHCNNPFMT